MSRKRLKQYLTLLMAIGVIAIVTGGTGTFASFNAEVSHTGNTYATGTLLLHATGTPSPGSSVTTTSTCASESNSGNANNTSPTGCAVLFNNVSIGVPASGTVAAAISGGSAITSFTADLTGTAKIEPGDQIKVSQGSSYSDTFTATREVTPGTGVTIYVESQSPNSSGYTTSATVAVQTYTEYADIQLKNAGTLDAKDIKFALNPACSNSAAQTLTLGTTTASESGTLATNTSIGISAAAYGAASGGTITITDGTNSDTLTLDAAVNPGDTTIKAHGTLSNSYTSGATIKYAPFVSGNGTLCSNLDFVIVETNSSFNHDSTSASTNALGCAYGSSTATAIGCAFSSSTAYTLGGSLTSDTALTLSSGANSNTGTELDHSQSRYFVFGIQANVASMTNSSQNQKATFTVLWHIDQK